jgi:alkanesulfonate monooxygenase SsuD/methylene tetrahydromethanopterin reductase-like flavin-dependent oxidoreductase (luciferase family)
MFRPGAFPLPHMVTCIAAAEAAGFDTVWFGDSHLIWHEVGPYLAVAARSTTRMRVGPLVANPVTRHPTVVASAIATLAELFDGRAVLGIGRGDSAVRTLGLRPMKVDDFRQALRLVRALCRGDSAGQGNTAVRLAWLTRTVPVLVAAYGPRVLELAGAEADGVILQVASAGVTEWALRHARKGAAAAGRALDDFEVVAAAPTYLSEDGERALARVRGFPATVSNHVKDLLRHYAPAELPPELVEGMAAIQGYDYQRHGDPEAPHTRAVTDQMAERLALIGTAERVAEKIAGLAAAGVTHVCLYLSVVEPEGHVPLLEAYGRLIIPRFRRVEAGGGRPG